MSKRFGRNQKRRMRETIASLEHARIMDAGLLRNQADKLSKARAALECVEKLLGEYTAALPPKRIKRGGDQADRGSLDIVEHSLGSRPYCDESSKPFSHLTASVTRLTYVVTSMKAAPDFGMHVIVDFAGRRTAYAANEVAIASVRKVDLIQHISESIATHLAHELSDKSPRGPATTRW